MQGVDHHELHQKAKKVAVSQLSDYPKFRSGESVADVAKHILEYGMPDTLDIDSHFEVLFKKDIVTQSEREYLFMKFHKLRLDTSIRSAVLDSLNLLHSLRTQVHFYQSFLDELLQAKLQLYIKLFLSKLSWDMLFILNLVFSYAQMKTFKRYFSKCHTKKSIEHERYLVK